jgi:signal transduction histidine kinase
MGQRLDDATFALRQQVAIFTAIGVGVIVAVIGVANYEADHTLLELMPVLLLLTVGARAKNRDVAMLAMAMALMGESSLLVHYTGGLIEAHFLYFVLLPLVALYQNWRPFLVSIGFVVFHHGVVGTLYPEAVYNHQAAIDKPVLWGIIHATFVVGLVIVLIIEWNYSFAAQRLAEERLAELEATQADLVQAQKLESVGQLAAGIAHEINTPMQYIGDNAHFMKGVLGRLLEVAEVAQRAAADGATEDDRAALVAALEKSKLHMLAERAPKAADDTLAGVENVSRIVTAMKRFSHPGSDEMEPVDLNEALTTTLTVCRNEWKYSADVETDLAADLPAVEGRHGPLNQVWLNMIVNASHAVADRHGDKKGQITITTTAVDEGRAAEVRIADNGVGIAEENLQRIFDYFFTTKPVSKGTGQGLAIARQVIVEDHQGKISVDSTLGEGTTFIITLPTTQPPSEPEPEPQT